MFVVVKKKHVLLAVLLIVVLVVSTVVGAIAGEKSASARSKKLLPVYAVNTSEKKVALSFDAAWGSDKTEKILDILDQYNAKATFFLVGFWIDSNPDLTQEIASRGHLIGNHSENHPHMPTLSKEDMAKEIKGVNQKVFDLTGAEPVYFRPPYGDYNNELIETIDSLNMTGVQWDVDSLDWKGILGAEITTRILSRVKEGSIILCHNNSDHILDALPTVLLGLENKGYKLVRMDELVYTENYSISNDGIQTKLY